MASKTQYAKLSLHPQGESYLARITTDHGTSERLLKPSQYPRPGWRLRKAERFAFASGWKIAEGSLNWYGVEGVETRSLEREVELCPNGQGPEECSEIDPCESCTQDGDAWGDLVEESMGLR